MKTAPVSNMDVRRANRNRIYRFLHANDGVSKPEIAQRLQISLPTVLVNIKSLIAAGLVRERGNLESTGGRKAVAMSIVRDAKTALGLDITRKQVVVAHVLLDGSVAAIRHEPLPFRADDDFIDAVGGLVEDFLRENRIDRSSLIGAGVSIPGILSADGAVLRQSHVLRITDYSFDRLDARLGLPCTHLNDASAAGVGEMWGADPDWHFVYMSLTNSVGGALMWEGRPIRGDHQRGGEIGHMTLERNGGRCYCGKRGCLDVYCAASVLSSHSGGDLSAFFDRLDAGDPAFRTVWDDYLDNLATAVNSLRMIFDCDVVIGGYVGARMEERIDELRRRAAVLNTFEESGDYVKVCRRKTEASAVGAALSQVNEFIAGV
ncbi:MAG: ROK family transcriptional regulator [Planctomycetaceae bacterium]|nr:ROK family transcriptional regulator [Planctomycetaceae bacterium]